ncbi:hypothetical protein MCO_01547 [Bartonella sp. DB5-6]|uniref:hypothetical protein n=1 Tax=Bartonella sp. DB5-6 TaxID=1094755 RepID=UPI00026E933D|nr:hypothetical protein [Bartonella sp. DB5-6]EJF76708.1 hypothetical protein MCO_01547 [Bartonella sp. DB5-6]
MKKYGLITLLSLSFISHATSQTTSNVDEYYQNALASIQRLDTKQSSAAETIYENTTTTEAKIKQISDALASKENLKPEELQDLQIKLSLIQANLQTDALKLQSLSMIQTKDIKTKEEIYEEEAKKKNNAFKEKLKEEIAKSDVRF